MICLPSCAESPSKYVLVIAINSERETRSFFRNHTLRRRRMRDEVLGIIVSRIGLRPSIRPESRITFAIDHPLRFADLAVLHTKTHCDDGEARRLLQNPKVPGLPSLRIEVAPLYLPQRLRRLPQPRPRNLNDSILRLAEPNRQRRRPFWIVLPYRIQILVERGF